MSRPESVEDVMGLTGRRVVVSVNMRELNKLNREDVAAVLEALRGFELSPNLEFDWGEGELLRAPTREELEEELFFQQKYWDAGAADYAAALKGDRSKRSSANWFASQNGLPKVDHE